MSEEQLKAFIAKAKDDQSIQEMLKAAKTPEDVIGIAKEHGYEFTADKISKLGDTRELSEDELEGLAGGYSNLFCADAWNTNGVGGLFEGRDGDFFLPFLAYLP